MPCGHPTCSDSRSERGISPDFEDFQQERQLSEIYSLRRCKDLKSILEQDYRFVKRRVNSEPRAGTFARYSRRSRVMKLCTCSAKVSSASSTIGREP
jgi:hypothetical protein